MTKKTYSEKLLNPKWQRKRLHIFNRDNFACTLCHDTENTLHVHHMKYEKGKEPWEYEDNVFKTVCEDCHLIYEDFKGTEYEILGAINTRNVNCMKLVAVYVNLPDNDDEYPLDLLYFFSINRETRECQVLHRIEIGELNLINSMMSEKMKKYDR